MANNDPKANNPRRFEDEQKRKASPGNFANDPQRASEAGRKGGEHSGQQEQAGSQQRQQGEERKPGQQGEQRSPTPPKNDQQR